MTVRGNYRDQARAVRREARAQLQALRNERRATRRTPSGEADDGVAPLSPPQAPEPVVEYPADESIPETLAEDAPSLQGDDAMADAPSMVTEPEPDLALGNDVDVEPLAEAAAFDVMQEEDVSAEEDADPAITAQSLEVGECTSEEILERPDMDVLSDVRHAQEGETETVAEAIDGGETITRTAEVSAVSDLFELPGAGVGLVWMLQQCGITSLEELARSEVKSLSAQLGVVGHILNIEPWVAFARNRAGTD